MAKLFLPLFDGVSEDPKLWLESMEDYFEYSQISMDLYVKVAIHHLRGVAAYWAEKNKLVISTNWCAFSYNFLWEFDPSTKMPEAGELIVEKNDNSDIDIEMVVGMEVESEKETDENDIEVQQKHSDIVTRNNQATDDLGGYTSLVTSSKLLGYDQDSGTFKLFDEMSPRQVCGHLQILILDFHYVYLVWKDDEFTGLRAWPDLESITACEISTISIVDSSNHLADSRENVYRVNWDCSYLCWFTHFKNKIALIGNDKLAILEITLQCVPVRMLLLVPCDSNLGMQYDETFCIGWSIKSLVESSTSSDNSFSDKYTLLRDESLTTLPIVASLSSVTLCTAACYSTVIYTSSTSRLVQSVRGYRMNSKSLKDGMQDGPTIVRNLPCLLSIVENIHPEDFGLYIGQSAKSCKNLKCFRWQIAWNTRLRFSVCDSYQCNQPPFLIKRYSDTLHIFIRRGLAQVLLLHFGQGHLYPSGRVYLHVSTRIRTHCLEKLVVVRDQCPDIILLVWRTAWSTFQDNFLSISDFVQVNFSNDSKNQLETYGFTGGTSAVGNWIGVVSIAPLSIELKDGREKISLVLGDVLVTRFASSYRDKYARIRLLAMADSSISNGQANSYSFQLSVMGNCLAGLFVCYFSGVMLQWLSLSFQDFSHGIYMEGSDLNRYAMPSRSHLVTLHGWTCSELRPFSVAPPLSPVSVDIDINSAYADKLNFQCFVSKGFSSYSRSPLGPLLCVGVYGMCSSALVTVKLRVPVYSSRGVPKLVNCWVHIHTTQSWKALQTTVQPPMLNFLFIYPSRLQNFLCGDYVFMNFPICLRIVVVLILLRQAYPIWLPLSVAASIFTYTCAHLPNLTEPRIQGQRVTLGVDFCSTILSWEYLMVNGISITHKAMLRALATFSAAVINNSVGLSDRDVMLSVHNTRFSLAIVQYQVVPVHRLVIRVLLWPFQFILDIQLIAISDLREGFTQFLKLFVFIHLAFSARYVICFDPGIVGVHHAGYRSSSRVMAFPEFLTGVIVKLHHNDYVLKASLEVRHCWEADCRFGFYGTHLKTARCAGTVDGHDKQTLTDMLGIFWLTCLGVKMTQLMLGWQISISRGSIQYVIASIMTGQSMNTFFWSKMGVGGALAVSKWATGYLANKQMQISICIQGIDTLAIWCFGPGLYTSRHNFIDTFIIVFSYGSYSRQLQYETTTFKFHRARTREGDRLDVKFMKILAECFWVSRLFPSRYEYHMHMKKFPDCTSSYVYFWTPYSGHTCQTILDLFSPHVLQNSISHFVWMAILLSIHIFMAPAIAFLAVTDEALLGRVGYIFSVLKLPWKVQIYQEILSAVYHICSSQQYGLWGCTRYCISGENYSDVVTYPERIIYSERVICKVRNAYGV